MSDVLFIGLGAMGGELACRLAAPQGYTTFLHDLKPLSVENLTSRIPRSKGFNMSAQSEPLPSVVYTCLPSSTDVEQVLQTFLDRVKRGTLWFDCTSGDPFKDREFEALLRGKEATFVDVGVSGGPRGAAAGSLTAMVGCPTDVFQKVQPFLESCAERIVHCGDTGAGHAVKAVNNIIMGTNLVIASEGLSILAKYGVSPAAALAIINESSGRSWATQDRMQNYILPGTYDYGFQLSLLEKDMSTALQLASGCGNTTPLLTNSFRLVSRASQTLSATADHTRLAEVVAKLQSTTLVTHKQSSDKQPKSPSMRALGIKLVVFDCAGTIIDEGGLVYNVLKQVMRRAPGGCITYTEEEFNRWHGGNKIELLRFFGYRAGMSEEEVQGMYTDFLSSLQTGYFSSENKGAVTLIPGVIELFYELRRAGIKVCLNTGYPHSIADRLIQVLELEDKIDGLVVAEDVGMGRPYPYMIQHLARLHNIVDMRHIVKLGDSVRDIEEGRFSGCGLVVGVLTGADSAEDHIKAGADLVLKSVADLSV
ncbi:hypothetical protein H2248_005878 [Termitomyces sp. 'cryptogamus']|nr:hypothetical protein H2248_005878 [Termitomyces sp. 'cryptogamus']